MLRSPLPDVEIPDVPLTNFVLARAGGLGEKPALIDGPSGRTITYAQLAESVHARSRRAWPSGALARATSSRTTPQTCRSMRSRSTRSRPSGA
jgi:hypothetical protein